MNRIIVQNVAWNLCGKSGEMGMIKEYIIKIDEDTQRKDINGGYPLLEPPQELVRCRDCRFREDPQSVISEWLPCQFGRTPDDWFCACGRKDPREECEA